jgi:hypothetical protein
VENNETREIERFLKMKVIWYKYPTEKSRARIQCNGLFLEVVVDL